MLKKPEDRAMRGNTSKEVFAGLLIGGLAGVAALMIFTLPSGKKTRADVQLKSRTLRDKATYLAKDALAQFRADTRELMTGVREKTGLKMPLGRDKLGYYLDRISATHEPGKMTVCVG